MNKEQAITLGVFVAPAVPAAITALGTPITRHFELSALLGLFPIFYVVSMMFMAIFGVPLIFIGISRDLVRWWSSAIAGACVGTLVGFGFNQRGMDLIGPSALGAVTGLTFWLIWRIGRDEVASEQSEAPTTES